MEGILMTEAEKNSIYMDAIDYYGTENQALKACEECGELVRAISRAYSTGMRDNLIEEIADVEVVVEQQMLIHGISRSDIEHVKEEKIERLRRRISGVRV